MYMYMYMYMYMFLYMYMYMYIYMCMYQLMRGPVIVFTHIPIHTRALSYTLTLLYQLMRGPVHMAIESGESRSIRGIDPYTPKASIPSPPTSSSFTTHLAHPFIHHDIPPSIVAQ